MYESIHKLINWKEFSKKPLTEHQINCYQDYVKWDIISRYQSLSESFIEQHKNRVHWPSICIFQKLSEQFIEKYKDLVDWEMVSEYQTLSEPFIEKHRYLVYWPRVCFCQSISTSFIEKYIQTIEWDWLSTQHMQSQSFKERFHAIKKSKLSYSIDYLPHYPRNRKHLQVTIELPCIISKGQDNYWFKHNNKHYETKPQYWYVDFGVLFDNSHSKGFVNEQKAVDWAVKRYTEYLKSELNRIKQDN